MRRNNRRTRVRRGYTNRRPTNFNARNALVPSVYPFTRSFENLVVLEAPSGSFESTLQDNLVIGHIQVNLAELPGYTELQSLFAQYKLNGLTLKCTPTYQLDADPASTETIICDVWRSSHGQAPTAAFRLSDLLQIQKRQSFVMPQRKPFTRNMMLTQLNNVYTSALNTDYTVQKPKYLSTAESSTPHYGISFCFRRPDAAPFTSNSPRLLMNYTVKLTCKQVV